MDRRHGIWRCCCGAEIYARPTQGSKKHHDKLTVYAPRDHLRNWVYERKNDRFLHRHSGKIGWLKADFVEGRDVEDGSQQPPK